MRAHMAQQTPYSDKRFLILDDQAEMRSSLRSQVGSLGCEQVTTAASVRDALQKLSVGSVDVILCDFYLGGGTDGQQFLEYLRTRRIIGRGVLFIMVTAEKGYESVVTAAECLPDDYLLKPFTADALRQRLERLLERKRRLARIDQLQDAGNWTGAASACDEIIAARDRYLVDALRIKGNALVQARQADNAIAFYRQVLSMRPLPWAKLGLARALQQQGSAEAAKQVLGELIDEAPKLTAAYDLLGKLHQDSGNTDAAIEILDKACRVAPNSLARQRSIAAVAEQKGDFARVEQALGQVIRKTRHSPLRETADFARLGNAYCEMGEAGKAVGLLEEARATGKEAAADPLLAAVEAIAQKKAGNAEKAAAALERALQADPAALTDDAALNLARACLLAGRQDSAQGILRRLVQGNPEAKQLHERITAVLRDNGAPDLAEQLVAESIREIVQLNNDAVRRAKAGDVAAAGEMLCEAAHRLPTNLQIMANAALVVYLDIFRNGLDSEKLRSAQAFQQAVQAQQPNHPKLAEIAALAEQVRSKYGRSD